MALDVLVTGSSGVLGSRIVEALRTAGHRALACGRVAGAGLDAVWDISRQNAPDPDSNPATVVHAAAKVGSYQQALSEATELFDVNVTGTFRVARWCVAHQVKRLILISGAIIYGEWDDSPKNEEAPANPWPAGPYAVSKWCSEQVAALVIPAGVELTVLRLSSLYGAGYDRGLPQRLLKQGQTTGSINLDPPFDDAFDLLHVRDAACTVERALAAKQTGLWNVGGRELTTIGELAAKCGEQATARVIFSKNKQERERRILNWVCDQKAREELGHLNDISVTAGIAEIAGSTKSDR